MIYPPSIIDEFGRIFITPLDTDHLDWQPGTVLQATGSADGTTVTLQAAPMHLAAPASLADSRVKAFIPDPIPPGTAYVTLNPAGWIALPAQLRKQVGWRNVNPGDTMTITPVKNGIALQQAAGM